MSRLTNRWQVIVAACISAVFLTANAEQTTPLKLEHQQNKAIFATTTTNFKAPVPDVSAKAYILMDYNSGQIISNKNGDDKLPPASLTKMMTMYIVSSAIKSGQLSLDTKVRITEKAWRTGGSRMFVKVNTNVPAKELLQGIIVASGNDACVALAQHIAGSEEGFAELMNQTAKKLGMNNTHFVTSTGLPDENHYSTAKDIAILAHALIRDYPEYYQWYKQKWFTFNDIKQPNRNRLLWRDESVDGIKTGHTDEAGFCLASSAVRNNVRLIAVVIGSKDDNSRATDSESLLNFGFRFYESHKLFSAKTALIKPRVWQGSEKTAELGLASDFYISIPYGQYANLKASITTDKNLKAPIVSGEKYGTVEIKFNDKVIAQRPVVALEANPKGGVWARSRDSVILFFHNLFG